MTAKTPRVSRRGLKAKGDAYERELATFINDRLFGGAAVVSRAPLSGGGFTSLNAGGADLMGLPLIFTEAKRVEALSFHAAMAQAVRNASLRDTPDLPTVIARRNRMTTAESLVVMRLSDWLSLYRHALADLGLLPAGDDTPPPPA